MAALRVALGLILLDITDGTDAGCELFNATMRCNSGHVLSPTLSWCNASNPFIMPMVIQTFNRTSANSDLADGGICSNGRCYVCDNETDPQSECRYITEFQPAEVQTNGSATQRIIVFGARGCSLRDQPFVPEVSRL
jgi:hypothetical protein